MRAYDSNGNRKSSGSVSQSATGTHNRLQTDGMYNYIYDAEGNTTKRTLIATGAVTEYTWDHRNRLTSVTERVSATGAVTQMVEFVYDAFNQRVGKRVDTDGDTDWDRHEAFVWADGHEVLRLVDSDGQGTSESFKVASRYLYGDAIDQVMADEQYDGNGPLVSAGTASTQAGETLWTLGDHLGSVRDVVDNNGVTRQHVVYDSFGNRLREVDYNSSGVQIAKTHADAIDELFGYTGRDWDEDIKLQNNRARWYDPTTGRWLSQDPIGFSAGDANLYRYVGNRPTSVSDPSGLIAPEDYNDEGQNVLNQIGGVNSPNYGAIMRLRAEGKAFVHYYRDDPSVGYKLRYTIPLSRTHGTQDVLMFDFVWGWFRNSFRFSGVRHGSNPETVKCSDDAEEVQRSTEIADFNQKKMKFEFALATAFMPSGRLPLKLPVRAPIRIPPAHPTFEPGPFADESILAVSTSQRFTAAERQLINAIGNKSGCHTCGSKTAGTKSGNFVPDHQPPSALNTINQPQQLYPQCIHCSREQGLAIARQKRGN